MLEKQISSLNRTGGRRLLGSQDRLLSWREVQHESHVIQCVEDHKTDLLLHHYLLTSFATSDGELQNDFICGQQRRTRGSHVLPISPRLCRCCERHSWSSCQRTVDISQDRLSISVLLVCSRWILAFSKRIVTMFTDDDIVRHERQRR